MEGLSSPGIGSGLDITAIVKSLVDAEIQPKSLRLAQQEFDVQSSISAIGQIKGALSNFQSNLAGLKELDAFQARKATVSDTDILSVTATEDASINDYQIDVSQLAKRHSLASKAFIDKTTDVGSGTLTIEFGSYNQTQTTFTANPDKSSQQIEISSQAKSLTDIRDAVNNADVGISASIVTDESGSKLLFSSDDTGAENALKITMTDDDGNDTDDAGLSQLIFDPVNSNDLLTQTVEAQDSSVIINGLTITHHSNDLSDNIDGLSINLIKASPGNPINVTISQDRTAARNQIQGFVNQFNAVMTVIDQLTAYDAETQTAGIFLGDASTRTLKSQLTAMLYEPIDYASSAFSTITEIGISTNSSGKLNIDDDKLDAAFDSHFDEVGRLFARGAYADDSLIKVNGLGDAVAEGPYAVNLTTVNIGNDLQGTIGGLAASSDDGKILLGTGALDSLSINVLGGSTGARGNVTVFNGIAARFDTLLSTYLGSEGSLESRENSLDNQITSINDSRARLELRAEKIEENYFNKFNALDSQLAQMEALSNFLTQQLESLPFSNQGDK